MKRKGLQLALEKTGCVISGKTETGCKYVNIIFKVENVQLRPNKRSNVLKSLH